MTATLPPGTAAIRIEPDPWLGAIMERRVTRVTLRPGSTARDLESADLVRDRLDGMDFAWARVPVEHGAGLDRLQQAGFRVVDTTVVFEITNPLTMPSTGLHLRDATPGDETRVVGLGAEAFSRSRFHLDPRISPWLADRVKSEWVRAFFRGERGDRLLVAERVGIVEGFLLLLTPQLGPAVIDLVAVSSRARRLGLGRALIARALADLPDGRALRAGTQLANRPAVRLYESLGFRLVEASYVLHYHRDPA